LKSSLEQLIATFQFVELVVAVLALVGRVRDINLELTKRVAHLTRKRPRSETLERTQRQLVLPLFAVADSSTSPKPHKDSGKPKKPRSRAEADATSSPIHSSESRVTALSRQCFLSYHATDGFAHPSIADGQQMLQELAVDSELLAELDQAHGFTVEFSTDDDLFVDGHAASFDLILFLNSDHTPYVSRDPFSFQGTNRALVTIHNAAIAIGDSYYRDLVGGVNFFGHGAPDTPGVIRQVLPGHVILRGLPTMREWEEEWYWIELSEPDSLPFGTTVETLLSVSLPLELQSGTLSRLCRGRWSRFTGPVLSTLP
jgi:hypothetical protein